MVIKKVPITHIFVPIAEVMVNDDDILSDIHRYSNSWPNGFPVDGHIMEQLW